MTHWFELDEADERAVAAFMARLAARPPVASPQDPMRIWWKAQLLQRWDAQRRVQAPLDVAERVEIVAGLAAAIGLIAWVGPDVIRLIAGPLLQLLG
jgi:hypothetical protein